MEKRRKAQSKLENGKRKKRENGNKEWFNA